MRWNARWLGLWVVTALLVAGAAGSISSAAPTAAPADDLFLPKAAEAIRANRLASLKADFDHRVLAEITDVTKLDLPRVIRAAAFRQFAAYFGQITKPTPDQQEQLLWLASQPRLLPTLMSAINTRVNVPDKVLELMQALRKGAAKPLDDYADLAAAFIVVRDRPLAANPRGPNSTRGEPPPNTDPTHLVRVFNYFENNPQLYFNSRDLPWQLAIYIADIKLSEDEMTWATNRYANHANIGEAYFDVPYDTHAFISGSQKEIETHDYTLQNLLQYGGQCTDQAYYASEIAKARGIPSCVCTGTSGAGQLGHAWLGFLEVNSGRAKWNFDEGRYKEDLFWAGTVTDPQTHDDRSDAEVGLLGELQDSKPEQRLASTLMMKVSDLVAGAKRREYLVHAIQLSPGNRTAWLALSQMAAENKLSTNEMDQVGGVIDQFASTSYPDFACEMLVRMAAGSPVDQQTAALDRIAAIYRNRPDLQAQIHIRQGELLYEAKRSDDALAAYGQVLTNNLNAGPIILVALRHVNDMLRAQKQVPRLAQIYDQVWNKMPIPDASAYVQTTPYFEVGEEYATLLEENGNASQAKLVRDQLDRVASGSANMGNRGF